LSVDPVTGIISGSATTSGSSLVKLTVTDGSFTTRATLQLIFTNDRALPVITSSSTAFLYLGQFFSYTITVAPACDPADVRTFAYLGTDGVLNGALPMGLAFDAQTRTISGIYMGESPESSAGQTDASSEDPLIGGDGAILPEPDRTIRPPFIATCQPFATHRSMDQPFATNGGTGTVPLNFFFGGPITDPATDIASFSATLNGAFAPDGLTTTVYFQYSTTSSYGSTTPVQTQTGNDFQTASADISSLTANTLYHYRMVAHN